MKECELDCKRVQKPLKKNLRYKMEKNYILPPPPQALKIEVFDNRAQGIAQNQIIISGVVVQGSASIIH